LAIIISSQQSDLCSSSSSRDFLTAVLHKDSNNLKEYVQLKIKLLNYN